MYYSLLSWPVVGMGLFNLFVPNLFIPNIQENIDDLHSSIRKLMLISQVLDECWSKCHMS